MGWIVLGLADFDESTINKFDVALELWKLHNQDVTLFNNEPSDLINNGGNNARHNKNAIIIYCTLVPIP
jgi:hypothetical protein